MAEVVEGAKHAHEIPSMAKANAALTTGIIGTSGFGLSLLNGMGGLLGGLGGKPVCNEDHFVNRYEAGQASRIAELETEVKLRDSNIYTDQKMLEVYKYFDGENKAIRNELCAQAVKNAQIEGTFAVPPVSRAVFVPEGVVDGARYLALPK